MIFDILVLAILLISAVIAFLRGLIREVLTILGVIGGALASFFIGPALSPLIRGWIGGGTGADGSRIFGIFPSTVVADGIAYGGIFIIVVVVLSVISHFLSGWVKNIGLGALDRTLGVLFGLVRGMVLIAILYLPFYFLTDKTDRMTWLKDSKSRVYIEISSGWLAGFLPDSLSSDTPDKAVKNADSIAKATREKLQELDVLREQGAKLVPDEKTNKNESAPGYEKDERLQLDQLFEQGTNN